MMNPPRLLSRIAGLAALGAASLLSAAEPPAFGIQAKWIQPKDDLKIVTHNQEGYGLEADVRIDLGHGHQLRPRLGYFRFGTYRTDWQDYKLSAFTLGADYQWFVTGRPKGLYLLAGVGMNRWKAEGEKKGYFDLWYNDVALEGRPFSEHTTRFAGTAGLGWQFTSHLGIEARYEASSFSKDVEGKSLQGGVRFQF